jgi:hypothetical protein
MRISSIKTTVTLSVDISTYKRFQGELRLANKNMS